LDRSATHLAGIVAAWNAERSTRPLAVARWNAGGSNWRETPRNGTLRDLDP
jgi:hypothetical protein